MSHTPGPWTCEYHHGCKNIVGPDNEDVCFTCGHYNEDTDLANALLIAAAPETAAERDRLKEINGEMLEALEQVANVINDTDSPWWIDDPLRGGFDIDRIEAIIAKAKGEAV